MAWTDERVEELKKLWAEGQSASQIAKQLGGVTRNAVIGKVHRLGLSGRAAPSRPARRPAATPARTRAPSQPAKPRVTARTEPAPAPKTKSLEPAPLPNGEFATVLTLKDSMCKWPIGDPATGDFRFCGRRSDPGAAYCEAHAQLAYQPQQKRRRRTSDANAALDAIAATRRVNF
ncbi:GcrA family cell cycle regulator [Hyphobacterium marinum]|uniref:GcrA family cell cycle regulator n=1 Tax=Hyphobacterium marinum TaxID=3116574 RepID=A0ABU7LWF9_9PROT|nr:GcrA family cell cycle regulator [Hyphobacterium sp. Y6023]MEE2565865.1 GcrA family cell cycle regulator [Hyphobacterium sp. Y6023]